MISFVAEQANDLANSLEFTVPHWKYTVEDLCESAKSFTVLCKNFATIMLADPSQQEILLKRAELIYRIVEKDLRENPFRQEKALIELNEARAQIFLNLLDLKTFVGKEVTMADLETITQLFNCTMHQAITHVVAVYLKYDKSIEAADFVSDFYDLLPEKFAGAIRAIFANCLQRLQILHAEELLYSFQTLINNNRLKIDALEWQEMTARFDVYECLNLLVAGGAVARLQINKVIEDYFVVVSHDNSVSPYLRIFSLVDDIDKLYETTQDTEVKARLENVIKLCLSSELQHAGLSTSIKNAPHQFEKSQQIFILRLIQKYLPESSLNYSRAVADPSSIERYFAQFSNIRDIDENLIFDVVNTLVERKNMQPDKAAAEFACHLVIASHTYDRQHTEVWELFEDYLKKKSFVLNCIRRLSSLSLLKDISFLINLTTSWNADDIAELTVCLHSSAVMQRKSIQVGRP